MSYLETIKMLTNRIGAILLIRNQQNPSWNNYFYWLIGLSLFALALSLYFRGEKIKHFFREDFGWMLLHVL